MQQSNAFVKVIADMFPMPVHIVLRYRGLYSPETEIAAVYTTKGGAEDFIREQVTEGEPGSWNEDDDGWHYYIQEHEVRKTILKIDRV